MKVNHIKKLYHTYLKIETINSTIVLQKLADGLSLVENPTFAIETEYLSIDIVPFNLSLQVLLDNTRTYMGISKFFNYDAYNNECQDFTVAVLRSNKMPSTTYDVFIKQNTEPLFNSPLKEICDIGVDMLVLRDKVENLF